MKAILLAGGEGTRLKAVTGDLPKPMVPLLGRPLMEHILRLLQRNGFTQVCVALKYRPEDIRSVFGDGSALGLSLEYRVETANLGTAGGGCHGPYEHISVQNMDIVVQMLKALLTA